MLGFNDFFAAVWRSNFVDSIHILSIKVTIVRKEGINEWAICIYSEVNYFDIG